MPRTSRRGREPSLGATVRTRRFGFFARIGFASSVTSCTTITSRKRDVSAAAAAASSVPVYATTPPKPETGSEAHAASNASAIACSVATPEGTRCFTIVSAFAPTTRDV